MTPTYAKKISGMLRKKQMTTMHARDMDSASEDIVENNLVHTTAKRQFGKHTSKNKQLWKIYLYSLQSEHYRETEP